MSGKGESIKQLGKDNIAIQNSEINISISIQDRIAQLQEEGDYEGLARLLKQTMDMAGAVHPYYPYYRFKPVEFGRQIILEHEPLSEEAKEKYPLTYRGRFTVPLRNHYDLNDYLDKAYVEQKEIEIDMVAFSTWLGENEVPAPNFEEYAKEGKWFIIPEPLPKALLLKLYIKKEPEVSIIDYLEMNIRDINREKYIVILDNSRQEQSNLLVTLKLAMNDTNVKIDVKIKSEFQNYITAKREFLLFIKNVTENQSPIAFKNLQSGTDFIVAPSFQFNDKFNNSDKEFRLMDRLYKIESYFNVTFTLPNKFNDGDWKGIEILESVMKNEPIKKKLNNLSINITEKEGLKQMIGIFNKSDNKISGLKVTQTGDDGRIELFGATIPLKRVETTYKGLTIKNPEVVKKKYEVFEDGEQVKVTLLPTEDDHIFEERYFI